MKNLKTYSELIKHDSFLERFRYLALHGFVGETIFGFERYLNQKFYRSLEWKKIRDHVIIRDHGCDLGVLGREVHEKIFIHHMNPLRKEDVINYSDILIDPEFLITTNHTTHNAIHYGDENLLFIDVVNRTKNDTCPWKK